VTVHTLSIVNLDFIAHTNHRKFSDRNPTSSSSNDKIGVVQAHNTPGTRHKCRVWRCTDCTATQTAT